MPNDEQITFKQVCTISVIIPGATDDEAIAMKKKVSAALVDTPDARVDFRIAKVPQRPTPV